jgi:hypothetical protein
MCEAPELPKSKKRNGNFIVFNTALKRSSEAPLERGFFRQPRKILSDELG